MNRVEGQVAVITGGASGIGRATALQLAAEGAAVVIGDLSAKDANEAAEEIRAAGGRAAGVAVDVTSEDSLAGLMQTAISKFGRLDAMYNHVGGSNPRLDLDIVNMDMDEFDRTMLLNVRSTVLGCRLAIPHLIEAGGGSIINTASVGGLSGDFTQTAYGTAKAAVIRLTQYVATQYGQHRIRCNAVAPGAVMTPALRDNLPAEMIEGIRKHNALPFIGSPEDVANLMVFLASPESRYITGQLMVVDGGMSSHSTIAEIRRPG
ncbi:MAG: SDR family NAD(P)-dependent oxidoreductase [Ornithinimicrobium sp.]|uniref:SDR family NAD(P)-dependent oxidoreductase n=1 Tax=Ornithinimicrobium sp. TaxID=1977084 RepID=UPI0026DF0737|nr:SDR family NAD(P)-dependent oxidoreductase [Ornithinimicrobium sp.]MDO5739848.1 SDR family NAD(P)-dependent oxidoreductase [Ornithinimicrobium sp.]